MRVVFLCAQMLNEFQARVIGPFLGSREHEVAGCVIDRRKPKPLLTKLVANLRRGRGGYVLVMAARRALGGSEAVEGTREFFARRGLSVVEVEDIDAEETVTRIRRLGPDILILVGGFGIVRRPLLDAPSLGVLSYHHGDLRAYRGQPPALWELYNGEKEMGITVQKLSAGLDRGAPVVEKRVPIAYGETLASLERKIFAESAGMMFEAARILSTPGFAAKPLERYGRLYTLPNLRQWVTLHLKVFWRRSRRLFGAGARA